MSYYFIIDSYKLSISSSIHQVDAPLDEQAESSAAGEMTQASLHQEVAPQHIVAAASTARSTKPMLDPLQRSPTLKTESADSDSATISATQSYAQSPATQSPAPSSSSPTTQASPEHKHASKNLQVAIKLLVSNSASGLIIGRSGSTISDLQVKSQTRIKLSQGGDYYPGTSDRVCLIQGYLSNAFLAVEMVLEKLYDLQASQQLPSAPAPALYELQNSSPAPASANTTAEVDSTAESAPDEDKASTTFIVRLLVPSTCCGMIIGRSGSNIKSLKEKSEVSYIQLSPKEHQVMIGGSMLSTSERIMTITGPNFSSCVKCVRIILNDMGQNPDICRYINMTTSYTRNLGAPPASSYAVAPPPGYFLDHEPFQQHIVSQPQLLESPPRYGMGDQFMQGQFCGTLPDTGLPIHQPDQSIGLLQQQLLTHQDSPSNYDMIQRQLYDQQGVMPSPARNIDSSAPSPSMMFPQYQQQPPVGQFWSPDATGGSPGRLSTYSGNISSIDQLSQSFQTQASLPRHPSHSSLHSAGSRPAATLQLGVPDARIGSILGRGGKTLTELQTVTRTKIRISQRGEFIPGTQNRVVTITGNTVQDVEHAQHLVNQRLDTSFSRSGSSSDLLD